jgi:hypothetical protein
MIPAGTIYAKTRAGQEEVKSRKIKLPPKLRTMLILIDGTKPAFLLREEAAAIGAAADFLDHLERLGLVERVGQAGAVATAASKQPAGAAAPAGMDTLKRFRLAQQFMNDTAVDALGIRAFFFTLKLERCATVEDLRQQVNAYREAIAKASGHSEAEVLSRRLLELLGPEHA